MDIESAATAAIKSRIADTELLSQYINERDKEPIWDGAIYAYRSTNWLNENLIGRAPVQVKGKMAKSLKKSAITYPVSLANLEQYRNDGGVIYFVVYLTEDKQKKIYYASLLPYVLNQYIGVAHGKSISINLKALPDKDTDFENIVINFVNERRKQIISKNGKNWTIEEVTELLGVNNVRMNCNFTCIGYDKRDPFSYLKDNELYLYAENKDGSLTFPVGHVENIEMMVHEPKVTIFANGHHYYDKVKIERHRDNRVIICIGKSFRYIYDGEKVTFKYALNGNLDEQIEAIRLLFDIIADKGIYINDVKCPIEPTQEELEKFDLLGAQEKLKYFLIVKEMLDKLGINIPLDLEKVTAKQEDYIRMLINTIVYGNRAGFNEKGEIPPLVTIEVGNLYIMLLFRQMEDERYEVTDFFRNRIFCTLDQEGNYDTTQFCLLTAKEYLQTSNLSMDIVEQSFKEHRNKGHFDRTTLCVLEMIKAYDMDHTRTDILRLAERLNKWLRDVDVDNMVHEINLFQCYKRQRDLNDQEIERLNEMFSDEINLLTKAGIQILLGNKRLTDLFISKMHVDEIKIFMEYPIYNLYKELN